MEIANHMKVSKPSTCRALGILAQQGYIEKEKYGAVKLTELGSLVATNVQNKHRAVKMLLVDILKVSPLVAEIDACKIEHSISEETAQKLFEFLSENKKLT